MRKLILLLGILSLLPLTAHAQGLNLYGGYSYVRLDSSPNAANLNGWDASFTDNFVPAVGITADLSGAYGSINGVSGSNFHTFLFGPQLRFPAPVSPFVRGLVGGVHVGGGGVSGTSLAAGFGGGIDIHVNSLIAFRPIQIDYIHSHFNSTGQDNFRISAGIVVHF
ncbi:MAG: outer membrane beta-barrel protein [Candidatus Acidiferrales bacterium]